MVTVVDEATAVVVTTNVALVAPAAIVTLGGTLAAPLLLESATCAPPVGAGPFNATVPVEEFPPATLVGPSKREKRVGGGGGAAVTGGEEEVETQPNAAEMVFVVDEATA